MQFSTSVQCLARGLALVGIVASSSAFAQAPATPAEPGMGTADRYTATRVSETTALRRVVPLAHGSPPALLGRLR
jgi:hypothetical protein